MVNGGWKEVIDSYGHPPFSSLHPRLFFLHSWVPYQNSLNHNRDASLSTISLPMFRAAVAAGEGALQTLMTRSDSMIRKSSIRFPSRARAWARTPDGAGFKCSDRISGINLCSALTNAAFEI